MPVSATTDRLKASLPPAPASGAGELSDPSVPPRLLLVDDEEALRLVVTEFVADLGLRAVSATNAADALDLLARTPSIELLLSDIRMAGQSGIELADQAALLRPGLRIVLMSGYFLPQPVTRRFLRKPFRLTELETLLREELGI